MKSEEYWTIICCCCSSQTNSDTNATSQTVRRSLQQPSASSSPDVCVCVCVCSGQLSLLSSAVVELTLQRRLHVKELVWLTEVIVVIAAPRLGSGWLLQYYRQYIRSYQSVATSETVNTESGVSSAVALSCTLTLLIFSASLIYLLTIYLLTYFIYTFKLHT